MPIRLLLAFRDEGAALALRTGLARHDVSGIDVRVADLAKLPAILVADRPHVLVLDAALCGERTARLLPSFRDLIPPTRILVLCAAYTTQLILACLKLGASGCVLRSDPPGVLVQAVRAVHGGDTWFDPASLAPGSLAEAPAVLRTSVDEGRLTQREEEIFGLLARGLTNKEIARELEISDLTVKTHLHRIYAKLHRSGRYKALLSQPNPHGIQPGSLQN